MTSSAVPVPAHRNSSGKSTSTVGQQPILASSAVADDVDVRVLAGGDEPPGRIPAAADRSASGPRPRRCRSRPGTQRASRRSIGSTLSSVPCSRVMAAGGGVYSCCPRAVTAARPRCPGRGHASWTTRAFRKRYHVLSPLGLGLDESAVACMRQSRYSPAQKDGKPVPLKINVSLAFEEHWDSDWHLGAAVFHPADGATRPVVVKANYPGAAGDHRNVTLCVRLTVGKDGVSARPAGGLAARCPPRQGGHRVGGRMAVPPGMQKGQPVDVPATFTLVHGPASRTMASSRRSAGISAFSRWRLWGML